MKNLFELINLFWGVNYIIMKKDKQGKMKKIAYGLLVSGSVLGSTMLVNNQTQTAHAATNDDLEKDNQADQNISTTSAAIQQQAVAIDANASQAPNPDLSAASRPDTSTVSRPDGDVSNFNDAVSAQATNQDVAATSAKTNIDSTASGENIDTIMTSAGINQKTESVTEDAKANMTDTDVASATDGLTVNVDMKDVAGLENVNWTQAGNLDISSITLSAPNSEGSMTVTDQSVLNQFNFAIDQNTGELTMSLPNIQMPNVMFSDLPRGVYSEAIWLWESYTNEGLKISLTGSFKDDKSRHDVNLSSTIKSTPMKLDAVDSTNEHSPYLTLDTAGFNTNAKNAMYMIFFTDPDDGNKINPYFADFVTQHAKLYNLFKGIMSQKNRDGKYPYPVTYSNITSEQNMLTSNDLNGIFYQDDGPDRMEFIFDTNFMNQFKGDKNNISINLADNLQIYFNFQLVGEERVQIVDTNNNPMQIDGVTDENGYLLNKNFANSEIDTPVNLNVMDPSNAYANSTGMDLYSNEKYYNIAGYVGDDISDYISSVISQLNISDMQNTGVNYVPVYTYKTTEDSGSAVQDQLNDNTKFVYSGVYKYKTDISTIDNAHMPTVQLVYTPKQTVSYNFDPQVNGMSILSDLSNDDQAKFTKSISGNVGEAADFSNLPDTLTIGNINYKRVTRSGTIPENGKVPVQYEVESVNYTVIPQNEDGKTINVDGSVYPVFNGTQTGKPGEPIKIPGTIKDKNGDSYTLISSPEEIIPNNGGNIVVEYKKDPKNVTYTVTPMDGTNTIQLDPADPNYGLFTTPQSGTEGETFNVPTTIKDSKGNTYTLKNPSQTSYDVPTDGKPVEIQYVKDNVTYTIQPQDKNGNNLGDPVAGGSGQPGSAITEFPPVKGYTPDTSKTIYIPDGGGVVNVTYIANSDNTVTINFIDSADHSHILQSPVSVPNQTTGETIDLGSYLPKTITENGVVYELMANATQYLVKGDGNDHADFYYQAKETSVTIHFVDQDGNPIAGHADVTLSGIPGKNINYSAPDIDGYRYIGSSSPLNSSFGKTDREITLTYAKNDLPPVDRSTITIDFVDEQGNKIKNSETLTGDVGSAYSIPREVIPGYHWVRTDGAESGKFDATDSKVTLVYAKDAKEQGSVTFHIVDENGNSIDGYPDQVFKGNVGDKYNLTEPTIDGYRYIGSSDSLQGSYSANGNTITLTYAKNDVPPVNQSTITIEFVDENGNTIRQSEQITGDVGSAYTVPTEVISGYQYMSADHNLTGTYGSENMTIILTYKKDAEETSNVTVHYVDEDGNSLLPDQVLTGENGKTYQISKPDIDDYTFVKSTSELNGTFGQGISDITLIYKKNDSNPTDPNQPQGDTVIIHYVDQDGNEIAQPISKTGQVGSQYNLDARNFTGYTYTGNSLSSMTGIFGQGSHDVYMYYQADTCHIIVKYVDENGNVLKAADNISGKFGTQYSISQPNIPGYTFVYSDGDLSGTYNESTKIIKLVYTKQESGNNSGNEGNNTGNDNNQENNNGDHNQGDGNGIDNSNNGNNSNNSESNVTNNEGDTTNNHYDSNANNDSNVVSQNTDNLNMAPKQTSVISKGNNASAVMQNANNTAINSSKSVNSNQKSLPKTGDDQNKGLVLLGLESLAGMFGLAGLKKRNKKQN